MTIRHLRNLGYLGGVAILAWAVSGCGEEDRAPERLPREVMLGAPVFRPSTRIAQGGSAETVETVFRADAVPDTVAAWYRRALSARGWYIVGDTRDRDGVITLYAQRRGPPLWAIIRPGPGGRGTEYSLIGVLPDTTSTER
ncbi:MAG: hypothetical protein GTN78_02045 [Gemmatimonadales bacterium]|nr:hypothetical protein [Gemmatimonadales bacterium]NIN10743.1 hypothetical protein [Gemmatimonadales bacterium]NIQ98973.1 hypothetical protein [Gemmatimonadales bacterium]NIS63792.1 hypothetical protein [Gemmatimonadales bacterium]